MPTFSCGFLRTFWFQRNAKQHLYTAMQREICSVLHEVSEWLAGTGDAIRQLLLLWAEVLTSVVAKLMSDCTSGSVSKDFSPCARHRCDGSNDNIANGDVDDHQHPQCSTNARRSVPLVFRPKPAAPIQAPDCCEGLRTALETAHNCKV